jgi:hypothetical protein
MVKGLGFRVLVLEFKVEFIARIQGSRFRVQGVGCKV